MKMIGGAIISRNSGYIMLQNAERSLFVTKMRSYVRYPLTKIA